MKALVLGGSGHLGCAVVHALLARSVRVAVASRQATTPTNLEGLDVELQPTLPLEGLENGRCTVREVARRVADYDLVVDAAAPYPLHPLPRGGAMRAPVVRRSELRMARLLDAVAQHDVPLLFVSSFTTRGRARALLSSAEGRLYRRHHPYFEVKEAMERRVLKAAEAGVRAVVVNPTSCLGPWDLKPPELSLVARLLAGSVPVVAETYVNVIDVRDVADGMLVAFDQKLFGTPIGLCGHNIGLSALCRWICEVGGASPPRWRGSSAVGVLTALGLERLASGLRQPAPIASLPLMLLRLNGHAQPDPAQRLLGLPLRPLSRTIHDSVHWQASLKCAG